jgi:hypothetical protein
LNSQLVQENSTIHLNYSSSYIFSCGSVNSRPSAIVDIINGSSGQSLTLSPNVDSVNTLNQCDSVSSYCTSVISFSISLNNPKFLFNSLICTSKNNTLPYSFNSKSSTYHVNIIGAPNN